MNEDHKILQSYIMLLQAQASYADGSPARNATVIVRATINNGQRIIFNGTVFSASSDGSITRALSIPDDANCLKITVSPSWRSY